MPDPVGARVAQDAAVEIACDLMRITKRLSDLAAALPHSHDLIELVMGQMENPGLPDVAFEVGGLLLAAKESSEEATRLLVEASQVTEDSIRREELTRRRREREGAD